MTFTEIGNTLHCSFSDKLDGHICSTIEQGLACRIDEFKNHCQDAQIIFDLAGVVFISSAFLRLCLIQFKTFGKSRFFITNVSEDVYKVFHVSGFVEIMNVAPA